MDKMWQEEKEESALGEDDWCRGSDGNVVVSEGDDYDQRLTSSSSSSSSSASFFFSFFLFFLLFIFYLSGIDLSARMSNFH